MKKAVIVVGSHHAGKSKTINQYFKPLVGISSMQRKFLLGRVLSKSLEEKEGHNLSQSFEEKGLEIESVVNKFINEYARFLYVVCAARPENESPSYYKIIRKKLEDRGFNVKTVSVIKGQSELYYQEIANEIYTYLQ